MKEMTGVKFSVSSNVVSPDYADDSLSTAFHEDATPRVRWEETIIEISRQQGYTGLAL